ncbi:MAG: hypothetical protein ACOYEW_01025 [Anaerolineae bacterium]
MKCYCYETETEFVLCVEGAEGAAEENVREAWFQKVGTRYIKPYPKGMPDDGFEAEDRELISRNFPRLGPAMFEGGSDWRDALLQFAQTCSRHGIEWYLFGSASEAVRGVNVRPQDIDIIVHTRDFFRVKRLFLDSTIEPFVDNKGTWLVRYFGRLCLGGFMVDVAADEKMNRENHQYDEALWNGYRLLLEPLQARYQTELQRNRQDRIRAIEAYMQES